MAKSSNATGPKPANQGRPIPHAATPPNVGKPDTPHSNGKWNAAPGPSKNSPTPTIRGSRKSF